MMRALSIMIVLVAGCVLPAEILVAQQPVRRIMVSGTGDLDFGRIHLSPGGDPTQYTDISPAQFSVTGEKGSAVRLMVSVPYANPRETGFSLAVSGRDCRYSTDGGSTWKTFRGGDLSHDTRFPLHQGPGTLSTIYVQVRGTATVMKAPGMRRGDCTAALRLTASYLDAADGLID